MKVKKNGFDNDIFLLGSLTLLPLTFQDLKSGFVDERPSSFMLGVAMLIGLINGYVLVFVGVMLFVVMGLPKLKNKFTSKLAAGDLTILSWVLAGICVTNFYLLPVFLLSLGFMGLLYAQFVKDKVRFVVFIFLANIITFSTYILFFI